MARIIRTRPTGSHWWSSLMVGAAIGALTAWLVLRGGGDDGEELVRSRRHRVPREPDLDAMTGRLRELPGAQNLRLRSLGNGILELVGSASAELDVAALLAALAAEPRVSVVVNRVWTPASTADLAPDSTDGAPDPDGNPLPPIVTADPTRPKPAAP